MPVQKEEKDFTLPVGMQNAIQRSPVVAKNVVLNQTTPQDTEGQAEELGTFISDPQKKEWDD